MKKNDLSNFSYFKKSVYICRYSYYDFNSYKDMFIIIIAKGQFPTQPSLTSHFAMADRVVCCDGAFANYFSWCRLNHSHPSEVDVVGDGDSLPPALLQQAHEAALKVSRTVVSEQESNDLSKAVHYALQQVDEPSLSSEAVRIEILGATGLREDHTLGNISLLAYYAMQFPNVQFTMVSDYGRFTPVRGKRTFQSHKGEQVSIFSFTPAQPVSVSGLRYPIEGRCLHWLWEGTLNESLGTSFEVSGGLLVVYQKSANAD